MPWIDACATDDIPAEDVIRFDHGGRSFVILRNHQGEYYCTDGFCTHENIHLSGGMVIGNTIECPKHSSVFDVTSGIVESPPACENLHAYPARIEGGRVQVKLG